MRTKEQIEESNRQWTEATKYKDLLRMALDDVQAILDNQDTLDEFNIEFSMDRDWCENRGGKCHTCLAGAVMLSRLTDEARKVMATDECLVPSDFSAGDIRKLNGLNDLRQGRIPYSISDATDPQIVAELRRIYYDTPVNFRGSNSIVDAAWVACMRKIQTFLEKHDL